ncbi:MAG: helix-turn-helix transcriptional regulator [Clostridia bacterium]|nr:helix-turn-helix transcriptional regulator [Clostridia bacterium]
MERGLSVRDVQAYFGFEEPRAIYKWQKGETLPSVDNLYALGHLLEVTIEEILVPVRPKIKSKNERQEFSCRSGFSSGFCFRGLPGRGGRTVLLRPIFSSRLRPGASSA